MKYHELKIRFDVKYGPPKIHANEDISQLDITYFTGDFDNRLNRELNHSSFALYGQFKEYSTEYHSKSNNINNRNSIRESSNYGYWNSKRVRWPELSKVSLWWSCISLSSIAAERALA